MVTFNATQHEKKAEHREKIIRIRTGARKKTVNVKSTRRRDPIEWILFKEKPRSRIESTPFVKVVST